MKHRTCIEIKLKSKLTIQQILSVFRSSNTDESRTPDAVEASATKQEKQKKGRCSGREKKEVEVDK